MKKYYLLGSTLCALSFLFLSGAHEGDRPKIVFNLKGRIASYEVNRGGGTRIKVSRDFKRGNFI